MFQTRAVPLDQRHTNRKKSLWMETEPQLSGYCRLIAPWKFVSCSRRLIDNFGIPTALAPNVEIIMTHYENLDSKSTVCERQNDIMRNVFVCLSFALNVVRTCRVIERFSQYTIG